MKNILKTSFLLASIAVLAACNGGETEEKEQPSKEESVSAFPVTLTDAIGNEVTIENEPERIITLSPVITEILFELDLGDQVVGVTDNDNYPEEVKELPSVGDMEFSAEQVIALEPDLVLAHESSMYATEPMMDQLNSAGIKVFVVDNAESIEATYDTFEVIGELTGNEDEAKQLVEDVQKEIATVQAKVEGLEQRSTFIVVGVEPDIYVVGQQNYMNDMLNLIGVKNLVEEPGWVKYSAEDFVASNPDSMLFTYASNVEEVANNTVFNEMKAVKENNLKLIDSDTTSRQGPRIAQGLESMAKAIYPEAFNE